MRPGPILPSCIRARVFNKARRQPPRVRSAHARRALQALCLWLTSLCPPVFAQEAWKHEPLISARFEAPTGRYPHGVLGDSIEFGALVLQYAPRALSFRITLPETRVFEDLAPRLADINDDGQTEAIVVESDTAQGARLAVYNGNGLMAATPFIGTRFRWLAPVGAADLDGDGRTEIAYVDRPHLAKRLRIWRYENGTLVHLADLDGVTNHRIGEDFISGGIRNCTGRPQMILARADWRALLGVTWDGSDFAVTPLGPGTRPSDLEDALSCS